QCPGRYRARRPGPAARASAAPPAGAPPRSPPPAPPAAPVPTHACRPASHRGDAPAAPPVSEPPAHPPVDHFGSSGPHSPGWWGADWDQHRTLEEEKMATVALIGTLDTKGTEYAWL